MNKRVKTSNISSILTIRSLWIRSNERCLILSWYYLNWRRRLLVVDNFFGWFQRFEVSCHEDGFSVYVNDRCFIFSVRKPVVQVCLPRLTNSKKFLVFITLKLMRKRNVARLTYSICFLGQLRGIHSLGDVLVAQLFGMNCYSRDPYYISQESLFRFILLIYMV